MKVISGPQPTTNFEKDDDEHIKTACNELIEVINNSKKSLDPSKLNEYSAPDNLCDSANDDDSAVINSVVDLSKPIHGASVRYFSGFVINKLFKETNCAECSEILKKWQKNMTDSSKLLIFHKNYIFSHILET